MASVGPTLQSGKQETRIDKLLEMWTMYQTGLLEGRQSVLRQGRHCRRNTPSRRNKYYTNRMKCSLAASPCEALPI